jgi:hypothetical protein
VTGRILFFNLKYYIILRKAHGKHSWFSGLSTMLQTGRSIYLILAATLGPGDYSASNINEYQKQKNNVSRE